MNNLDKHRKEIDKIDDNIIELLEQRFNLVVEIGQYKKENKAAIKEQINEIFNICPYKGKTCKEDTGDAGASWNHMRGNER